MLKNDAIFQLIQQLSPEEKKYYKRQLKPNADYALLFDRMTMMEVYDEVLLKKEFSEKKFITQLDVKKHYLYKQLLTVLRRFHESDFHWENRLQEAEILMRRKLYDQSIEILKKEYTVAERSENFMGLLRILSMQEQMAGQVQVFNRQKITREKLSVLKRYEVLQDFIHAQEVLLEWSAEYSYFRNAAHQARWKKIVSALKLPEKQVSSLQVKLIFDYIHYLYFASSGEWLKAHGYAQQMYRAVMDHQEATQSFSGYFLNACSAYLGTIAVCFGETSEFRRVLKFLKSKIHELDSAHFKVLAQTRIYQFELIVLRRSGDHQKVEKFLPEVVAFVEENGEELEFFKLKFIRFEIAKTYYQLQQRRLATKWFLQSVNPGQHGFSKDIFSFSRILYLINEIESGQTEHIKQSVQQLRAQLKKSGIYGEFETMLLRFISRDYVRYGDLSSTDRMKMFQGFQKELHRFYKSSFGKNFRLYFDFLNWVEEKIQHIER
jgi:hypothetical protein